MGNRRYVSDTGDNEAGALQRSNGGFPAGARPFDQHVYLAQSLVHTSTGGLFRRTLGSKGRTFSRPFETHGTRAG